MLATLMSFRFETVPGNNGFIIPFDSTRGPANLSYSAIAAGSAFLAPGPWRARFAGAVIKYHILCTTQALTLDEQGLTGNAGTSADWQSQASGTTVPVAAGTPLPREFTFLGPEGRILLTAGAAAPATCIVWGVVYQTLDRGS